MTHVNIGGQGRKRISEIGAQKHGLMECKVKHLETAMD